MRNDQEITRKHFRFPAYSDDVGVKIQRAEKRAPFSAHEPWILTEESDTPFYSRKEKKNEEPRDLRRSARSGQSKSGHSIQQKEELERHRTNLPDYTKRSTLEVTKTGKKQLFGEQVSKPSYAVREKKADIAPSVKREYSGRSYFVPKYIPASIIPDEEKPLITEKELLDAMAKPKSSYLLFDSEVAAYQERRDDEPSVKKFPSTDDLLTEETPKRSKKTRKRMSLNRSLDGMIAKETNDLTEKNYFK